MNPLKQKAKGVIILFGGLWGNQIDNMTGCYMSKHILKVFQDSNRKFAEEHFGAFMAIGEGVEP